MKILASDKFTITIFFIKKKLFFEWTLIAKSLKSLLSRLVVKLLIGNIFIEFDLQVQVTKTLFQTLKDHHQPHCTETA